MLSPVITPFILCFHLRSKSLDIVDFYRNFTVEVVGVGDVCSFAQMDVRRHGNPAWQTSSVSPTKPQAPGPGGPMQPCMHTVANQYMQVNVCLQFKVLKSTTYCILSCPFLKSFLKIAWYGERGIRENKTNKVRRETVTVVWLCRENEWDSYTENGARFKIEETGIA